jgi:hypothetical protein
MAMPLTAAVARRVAVFDFSLLMVRPLSLS